MKLHLPTGLRKALCSSLAALAAFLPGTLFSGAIVGGVCAVTLSQQAAALTYEQTTDVSTHGGVVSGSTVYSGWIFSLNLQKSRAVEGQGSQTTFPMYGGNNGETKTIYDRWQRSADGSTMEETELGNGRSQVVTDGPSYQLWAYFSDQSGMQYYGHTLRLAYGEAGTTYNLTTGFTSGTYHLTFGGLIVEAGAGGYVIGHNGNNETIRLEAGKKNRGEVHCLILSNTTFNSSGSSMAEVASNSDIRIGSGITFNWNRSVSVNNYLTLSFLRVGAGSAAAVTQMGALLLGGGNTVSVNEGVELTASSLRVGGDTRSVLNVDGKMTVTGTTGIERDVKLIITGSGEKTFNGVISLAEGATLEADMRHWTGTVSGDGTLIITKLGYEAENEDSGVFRYLPKHVELADGSAPDVQGDLSDAFDGLADLTVKAGASFGINDASALGGDVRGVKELHIAGQGIAGDAASAYYKAALFVGTALNGFEDKELNWTLVLDDDATIYLGHRTTGMTNLILNGNYVSGGHTLTIIGGDKLTIGESFSADKAAAFQVDNGTLALGYTSPATLAGFTLGVARSGSVELTDNGRFIVKSLSGEGALSGEGTLVIVNKGEGEAASFNGTMSDTAELEVAGGVQYVGSVLRSKMNLTVSGGVLDVSKLTRSNTEGSLNLTANSGEIRGLVLEDTDTLTLVGENLAFDFTMKGGRVEGDGAVTYQGIITIDDDAKAGREFDMSGFEKGASVCLGSLTADDTTASVLTGLREVTINGDSRITLGESLRMDEKGTDSYFFHFMDAEEPQDGEEPTDAKRGFSFAGGANLGVNLAEAAGNIRAALQEQDSVSYRITDAAAASLSGHLSFSGELALFNLRVELDEENGALKFTHLQLDDKGLVYQSWLDNKGADHGTWDAGDNVYESTDAYMAVYVDKATKIDLTTADMGVRKEDGLVLKNLMGTADGHLNIVGKGSGQSKVTIANNLDDNELKQLAALMQVEIDNRLTYGGNITLTGVDLQVKHTSKASTTQMDGCLTLSNGKMEMTKGTLELTRKGNVLGDGISFAGEDARVILNGATATVGGELRLLDGEAPITGEKEHIRMLNGAELTLKDADVDALTIGNIDKKNAGTLHVQGNTTLAAGGKLLHVALDLAKGSTLELNAEVVRAIEADAPAPSVSLSALSGSGALSTAGGAEDIEILPAKDATYSGSLAGYQGTMSILASPHTQTFSGVKGSKEWNLTNAGHIVLDLVGASGSNSITMGQLSLLNGSSTAILLDLNNMNDGLGLQLGSLSVESDAELTLTQYTGTVMLPEDSTGKIDIVLGRVSDDADAAALSCTTYGIRNLENGQIKIDDDGLIHLIGQGETTNLYAAYVKNGNAAAGANLLWGIPNSGAIGGDLAAVDRYVYDLLSGSPTQGDVAKASRVLAAVSGASTATLGQAYSRDLERQLRAIRNRTTSMGYSEFDSPQSTELPQVSMWINGEGSFLKQKAKDWDPGYKLNGWGGTVGAAIDVSNETTFGLALTAMYSDLETDGADKLKGDMDTYYLSGFARISSGSWLHTFVASVGVSRIEGDRTVDYGVGRYTTSTDTNGLGLGLMYEVGYYIPMNNQGTSCLQPVANVTLRYTRIDGYDETGSTAALRVDGQDQLMVTLGLGARMQSIVGANTLNLPCLLEARALLKVDAGDTKGKSTVSFLQASGTSVSVQSAKRSALGFEVGAGLSVPVTDRSELFIDFSADIRGESTELNAAVGYKLSF